MKEENLLAFLEKWTKPKDDEAFLLWKKDLEKIFWD